MTRFNRDEDVSKCTQCGQWLWLPRFPEAVCVMCQKEDKNAA